MEDLDTTLTEKSALRNVSDGADIPTTVEANGLSDRTVTAAIERFQSAMREALRKSAEKFALRATLHEASNLDAAVCAGLPLDRVEAAYAQFQKFLEEAMIQSAKRFVADLLASAPGNLPKPNGAISKGSMEEMIKALKRKHGIRSFEEIDDRGSVTSLNINDSDPAESPMKSVGLGLGRALQKYPVLSQQPGMRDALYGMSGDLMALVEDMEPAERAGLIDRQFTELVESRWPSPEAARELVNESIPHADV